MDDLHPWVERLSEYLDGELSTAEAGALESHLEGCDECRAVLEELRAIVEAAGNLEDRPPERDLWPGIAARIAPQPAPVVIDLAERRHSRSSRISLSLPQLAAAAIALMLLSGGSVWLAVGGRTGDDTRSVAGVTDPASGGVPQARFVADGEVPGYAEAVADLERVFREGRGRLDPATVAVLEANLAIIDRALEEARQAVARDPQSVYLQNHLAGTMRRKLQLLRQASTIVSAQT